MKRGLLIIQTAAVMLTPFSAIAHGAKQHKGKQTKGEIVSVTENRLELNTGKGPVAVLLSEEPKIEVGGVAATAAALSRGQKVAVIGTTLASGEIVAKEILVERSSPAPSSSSAHSDHAGHH